MNNTNTITFKYIYPENATDMQKYEIDQLTKQAVNKAFLGLFRGGHIADFYLIDEDMGVSK